MDETVVAAVRILRDGPASEPPESPSLSALVAKVRAAGLPVTLTVDGRAESAADPVVYRIVQESLTNTLKHAGSYARAQVRIRYSPGGTDVEISDDGAGTLPPPQRGGSGIIGISERVAAVGGTVEAGPLPGGGWHVRANLPH